ncbi:hypothetical protein O181_102223 [Austropuccinia psidii MF-1]|uniref:Uncharacterized protein n=1 Tax=Austropuccinia psidii MF-1 TaxID=1389203 RepID=A0A9Q3JFZ0_9BASI|nr:hypothetical protein [Austropuccinia psidii MF-1]
MPSMQPSPNLMLAHPCFLPCSHSHHSLNICLQALPQSPQDKPPMPPPHYCPHLLYASTPLPLTILILPQSPQDMAPRLPPHLFPHPSLCFRTPASSSWSDIRVMGYMCNPITEIVTTMAVHIYMLYPVYGNLAISIITGQIRHFFLFGVLWLFHNLDPTEPFHHHQDFPGQVLHLGRLLYFPVSRENTAQKCVFVF